MLRALLDRKAPLNSLADWIRFALAAGLIAPLLHQREQRLQLTFRRNQLAQRFIRPKQQHRTKGQHVQAILGGLMLRALLDRKAPLNSLADWIRFALAAGRFIRPKQQHRTKGQHANHFRDHPGGEKRQRGVAALIWCRPSSAG
jgi:hypothetical protein